LPALRLCLHGCYNSASAMTERIPLPEAVRERLDAFARELPGVEEGNVGALHRARVASRRLRELLPLLSLDHKTGRKLNRRLRKVTRRLGLVRELDVLGLLVDEFRRDGRYSPAALDQVGARVVQARVEARARLLDKSTFAKIARLIARLGRMADALRREGTNVRRPAANRRTRTRVWALDARMIGRAARVRELMPTAGSVYVAGQLHDVRIALKKLRYAAELSQPSETAESRRLAA